MPIFWEASAVLEFTYKLQVIVSDGASPNRKIYRMHEQMSDTDDSSVVYGTINIYSTGRYIFFTYIHTFIHTYVHTYIHTYIHT